MSQFYARIHSECQVASLHGILSDLSATGGERLFLQARTFLPSLCCSYANAYVCSFQCVFYGIHFRVTRFCFLFDGRSSILYASRLNDHAIVIRVPVQNETCWWTEFSRARATFRPIIRRRAISLSWFLQINLDVTRARTPQSARRKIVPRPASLSSYSIFLWQNSVLKFTTARPRYLHGQPRIRYVHLAPRIKNELEGNAVEWVCQFDGG